MHRLKFLVCALAVGAAACGNNALTSATTASNTSQEFTGTLTVNGGRPYPFAALAAGGVSATLQSLSPDATAIVGLEIGVWDGTACQPVVSNDAATTASVVDATATAAGSLCARIYDSTGTLPNPESYDIIVSHP